MLKNVVLNKLIYISVLLICSLIALHYLPAVYVVTACAVLCALVTLFMGMAPTLKNADMQKSEMACEVLLEDLWPAIGQLATLTKNSTETNQNDLTALISIQDSAATTLTDAFVAIEGLLSQQQTYIDMLLDPPEQEGALQEEKANKTHHLANQCHELAREIEAAVHDAMRGLQFGDISVQSLQFIANDLGELSTAMQRIEQLKENHSSVQLQETINTYQQYRSTCRNNPVSSESMESGETTLF